MEIGSVVVWPKKRSTNLVNNTIGGHKSEYRQEFTASLKIPSQKFGDLGLASRNFEI